jgi:UDP-N-acetylmuramate-alanine ligase
MGLLVGCWPGQVFGAVAQDHRFARARHAVDDAVAVAQAAGQLLLLQVHHAHDAGQLGIRIVSSNKRALWFARALGGT